MNKSEKVEPFEVGGINKRNFLYSLFESWHNVLKKYEEKMYEWDLPYSHGERPNIGHLATAASKNACLVLEEFSCDKKRGRHLRTGRADLWIMRDTEDYRFEAKRIAPNIIKNKISKEVKKALKNAQCDIERIPPEDRPTKSVGIVFVIPYFPKHTPYDLGIINSIKDELLDHKRLNAHFSAVHISEREIEKHKYGTPCIAIVGKWHEW